MTTQPLPLIERIVGKATGHALVWLGGRAARRGDWHESNHCLTMLAVGSSNHPGKCSLPTDRPMRHRPAVAWDAYTEGDA